MALSFKATCIDAMLDKIQIRIKLIYSVPKLTANVSSCGKTLLSWYNAMLSLPETTLPSNALINQDKDKDEMQFWCLADMMDFDNVGFSKTIGTVKYLSCADCNLGPIGYHDTASDPKEYLVSIQRARYRL
ncbi:unnamed protein product [Absidia cylindrospora]